MVTCFLCGFLLGQGMGPFLHFWGTQQRRTPEASRKQLISPVASRQSDNSVDISVVLLDTSPVVWLHWEQRPGSCRSLASFRAQLGDSEDLPKLAGIERVTVVCSSPYAQCPCRGWTSIAWPPGTWTQEQGR